MLKAYKKNNGAHFLTFSIYSFMSKSIVHVYPSNVFAKLMTDVVKINYVLFITLKCPG